MKILVLSDSHGNYDRFLSVLMRHKDADMIIHLGDGEEDMEGLEMEDPDLAKRIIYVGGNCDHGLHERVKTVSADGLGILISHGDGFGVKQRGYSELIKEAKKEGCKAAFFGHTHSRVAVTEDGIFLLNPGSCDWQYDCTRPSYAIVSVENGVISAEHFDV